MGSKSSIEEFLKKLYTKNKAFREGKFEVVGEYINALTYITLKDNYGLLRVTPNKLLGGQTPNIQSAVDKTQYYINKCREIHGDKYNYSNVVYRGADIKVDIFCNTCNKYFSQRAIGHCTGKGCNTCGNKAIGDKSRKSKEDFIKDAIKTHGTKFNYELVDYTHTDTKVEIICNACKYQFYQTPSHHINGGGCPKCKAKNQGDIRRYTTEDFINNSKKIHGGFYSYDNTIYKGALNTVEISCPIHGVMIMSPQYHYNYGCRGCKRDKKYRANGWTLEDFITKANNIYNHKYEYTNVNYSCQLDNVEVVCKEHGSFFISPTRHINQKEGCPQCGILQRGWTNSNWEKAGTNSPKFDGFKVYVMEFQEDDGTTFYKVGKTFQDIKKRIIGLRTYKPINTFIIKGIAPFCSRLEVMMHRALKEYKYSPKLKLAGSTECFSHIPDDIFNTLKLMSNEKDS